MTVPISTLPSAPHRSPDAHKGTLGSVLIVAGSRGMSGAAALCGLSALRGGAGLVSLAVPAGLLPIVAAVEPSYMTIPLPEDEQGRLERGALRMIGEHLPRCTGLAVGPGLGRSEALNQIVRDLFLLAPTPAVFDADALNALSAQPDLWDEWNPSGTAPRVFTPHPGEFARLTGLTTAEVQEDRETLADQFARERDVVLVLKGKNTVISDGKRRAINTTGNSGMATGGSGDVLTGLIASLLAQGMEAFEASQLAAHLHGLAGDIAAEELSEPGLIASDLPRYLAKAWRQWLT